MSKYFLLLAVIYCTSVSQPQQKNYLALIEEGKTTLDKNRVPQAIDIFRQVINMDTSYAAGYYQLGRAYMKYFDQTRENGDSALYYLDRSFRIDSTYGDVRSRRGYIKGLMHDFAGALNEYNVCILKNPDTGAYASRALVRYKLNDTEGTCNDLHEAVRLGARLPVEILRKKMINLRCDWMPEESKTALYNIRFVKAMQSIPTGNGGIQVVYVITPIKQEDFPPVISTKVVYSINGGAEKKSDILHAQDCISLTTYGKNIKEKSPVLYDRLKDLVDFSSSDNMMILVFNFYGKEMYDVKEMTMTYGCWEKQNTDQRVETKYTFKVEP